MGSPFAGASRADDAADVALVAAAPAQTLSAQAVNPQALYPQALNAPTRTTAANPTVQSVSTADLILRGKLMLDVRDANAVATLHTAAQQSLTALSEAAGPNILTAPPERMPRAGAPAEAARQAAEAHYFWSIAEYDFFAQRDRAITALARAARFAGDLRGGENRLARDIRFQLANMLRDGGLPAYAADDTLDTIAAVTHFGLWTPRRFRSDFSGIALEPQGVQSAGATPTKATPANEFLVTSGRLFASDKPKSRLNPDEDVSRIPPPYRYVPANALPDVLKLGPMIVGYAREKDGPNRGLWRQTVRVFYASAALTRGNRNDRLRAEALCAQFLKIHALNQAALGLTNAYTSDGVTTLWLAEVSALWPNDEDDPAVVAVMGPRMPRPNTPLVPGTNPESEPEIEMTPLVRPWQAAGYLESNPGDITFFKMTEPRDEAEWLRELAHEYGHVTLPAIDGFRPPLEPYGNGVIGETLDMLWAASAPGEFATPIKTEGAPGAMSNATGDFVNDLNAHISRNAMAPLRFWKANGPGSDLRRNGTGDGLLYLQGLAVYIERVYGARILGAALRPLAGRFTDRTGAAVVPAALNTDSLLDSLTRVLRDPFERGQATLPIWLPGALETASSNLSPGEFATRAPSQLRAKQRTACWLHVPASARALRIEWKTGGIAPQPLPLTVEGGWKTTFLAPTAPGATHGVRIDLASKSGWLRFAFTAPTDITWTRAWFEKAPTPSAPVRATGTR